jgi:hypothetical protein
MAATTAVTTYLAIAFIFCDESVSLRCWTHNVVYFYKCQGDAIFVMLSAGCRV